MLAETGKAAVIHPTGTGKSYIAFALVQAHPDEKFLWIAPSEYIYSLQTKKLLLEQDIEFHNIEFHTYAWLIHNERAFVEIQPDYIIFDEFHRAGAAEWGKSIHKLIQTYPDARLFGMSATNVRYLDNRRDMADELFEGAIASEMSLCEAMAKGILPEPKYVISVYSYEEELDRYELQIKKLKNVRQKSEAERLIEKLRRALNNSDGMEKVFAKHMPSRNSKVIFFCTNTEHISEMRKRTMEWFGTLDATPHIYQVYTSYQESEKDFQNFVADDSDHLKILFCIDMLNEGIHVDNVDAVVLCRPTESPIVYKQQIGRAIAAGSTKRPVIFDMVNNFNSLYQIDALKEEFAEMVLMYGDSETDDEAAIGRFEVIDELRDCRQIIEQIQHNLDATWDVYYQELCKYVQSTGSSKVPKRYMTHDGLYLGRWVQRQRTAYNENKLGEDRVRLLESVGITWETESDRKFSRWIHLLVEYKKRHGNLAVPAGYETPEGEKLGNWCYNIRSRYKKGHLSQERIELLDEMGFVWENFGLYWEDGYFHAKAYFFEHGNLAVTKRYQCDDGFKLGLWLSTQRNVRKGKVSGNLTEEKIRRLDAIGMSWESKSNDRFGLYIKAYRRYKLAHADSKVPFSYVDEDGMQLGKWAARMNRLYRADKLPEEKFRKLVAEGFSFSDYSRHSA